MKKNLFQAVKTYINGVEVGETFTTKHLIDMVGDHEVSTGWKQSNQNPYYRTHSYKSYLRRTGFISSPKRGVWKIEKHIPEFVTLGTIEFLLGYKKIYNGMTKSAVMEKINNTPQKSILLEFKGGKNFAAESGARAINMGGYTNLHGFELINVKWIRDGKDNGQIDGGYYGHMFTEVGELKDFPTKPGFVEKRLSLQEEQEYREDIRILSEIKEDKIMKVKFDFNEGILRVKKYLEDDLKQMEDELIQSSPRCFTANELRNKIYEFDLFERRVEQAIENLEEAGSILEVLNAVEDTVLGDDTLVLSLMLDIEIEMI
jgi:hypothetical protein